MVHAFTNTASVSVACHGNNIQASKLAFLTDL